MMSTEGRFDYQRYLASREWALKKKAVRARSWGNCERCGDASMAAVHHLTYERIGHERLDDLMAVCRDCHDWLSGAPGVEDPITDILKTLQEDLENGYLEARAQMDFYLAKPGVAA